MTNCLPAHRVRVVDRDDVGIIGGIGQRLPGPPEQQRVAGRQRQRAGDVASRVMHPGHDEFTRLGHHPVVDEVADEAGTRRNDELGGATTALHQLVLGLVQPVVLGEQRTVCTEIAQHLAGGALRYQS